MSNEKNTRTLPPLPSGAPPQTLSSDYTVTQASTQGSILSPITQPIPLPSENNASVNLIVPETTSSDYTVTQAQTQNSLTQLTSLSFSE